MPPGAPSGALSRAISECGKPKSILADRGSHVYSAESEKRVKGISEFEKRPESLGVQRILARVPHPQTNGKIQRVHGKIQRKLPPFFDVAGPPGSACPINPPEMESDPLKRFMKWYSYDRPHMSLNTDIEETPARAFEHKMPLRAPTSTTSRLPPPSGRASYGGFCAPPAPLRPAVPSNLPLWGHTRWSRPQTTYPRRFSRAVSLLKSNKDVLSCGQKMMHGIWGE